MVRRGQFAELTPLEGLPAGEALLNSLPVADNDARRASFPRGTDAVCIVLTRVACVERQAGA